MMIQDLRFQGLNIPLGGMESIWQTDIYHGYARESWYLPVIIPTEWHPGSKRWILQGRKACVCNRKPLWALAWLTLVETLVGQIASRCRQAVGLDEH